MKKNEKQQENVELIQTGMRILGNMVAYGIPTWSAEACWSKLVNIRLTATKEALEWLLGSSYVERSSTGQYAITTAGREAYEESRLTNSADVADTRAFRVEALTGMDVRGGQTRLTRAALPGLGSRDGGRNEETNIARCDIGFKIDEIAKEIGQSVEQTRQQMQTGQVHICQQCGKWARFHAHNGPRQQWQSSCITCRKRGRK